MGNVLRRWMRKSGRHESSHQADPWPTPTRIHLRTTFGVERFSGTMADHAAYSVQINRLSTAGVKLPHLTKVGDFFKDLGRDPKGLTHRRSSTAEGYGRHSLMSLPNLADLDLPKIGMNDLRRAASSGIIHPVLFLSEDTNLINTQTNSPTDELSSSATSTDHNHNTNPAQAATDPLPLPTTHEEMANHQHNLIDAEPATHSVYRTAELGDSNRNFHSNSDHPMEDQCMMEAWNLTGSGNQAISQTTDRTAGDQGDEWNVHHNDNPEESLGWSRVGQSTPLAKKRMGFYGVPRWFVPEVDDAN